MTKQEEIRGLTKVDVVLIEYAKAVADVEEKELMTHSMMRKKWGELLIKVKQDLSDLGVVIKAEDQTIQVVLPADGKPTGLKLPYHLSNFGENIVRVEPLIDGKDGNGHGGD